MSSVDDLIAFLRIALDDDERVARAAQSGPWTMRGNSGDTTPWTDIDAADGAITSSYEGEVVAVRDAEHITRWDPARVLAEVEAKRRILDEFVPKVDEMDALIEGEWGAGPRPTGESDALIKLLALPYADRPGYLEEWRP